MRSVMVMTEMHEESQQKKRTKTKNFIAIKKVKISSIICVITARIHAKLLVPHEGSELILEAVT